MPRARGTFYVAETDSAAPVVECFHEVAVYDDAAGVRVALTDPATGEPSEFTVGGRRFRVRMVLEPAEPLVLSIPRLSTAC